MFPDYKHVIFLDNSNNHGGKGKGGCDANAMNKGYTGAQAVFESNVLDHNDCFGEFPYTDSRQPLILGCILSQIQMIAHTG